MQAMKLDYERQCYRHSLMILRSTMQQLQASLGSMFKALNKACPPTASAGRAAGPGSTPAIPRLNTALIAPSAEINCEFKNEKPSESVGQGQPGPARSPADAAAEANLRLDYERQCYRHAEMILRDELALLQGSVREIVKAVNGGLPAANQPATSPQAINLPGNPSATRKGPAAKQSPANRQLLTAPKSAPDSAKPSPAARQAPRRQPAAVDAQRQSAQEFSPCVYDGETCLGRDPDARIRAMIYFNSR
jgi:hypothetical protein